MTNKSNHVVFSFDPRIEMRNRGLVVLLILCDSLVFAFSPCGTSLRGFATTAMPCYNARLRVQATMRQSEDQGGEQAGLRSASRRTALSFFAAVGGASLLQPGQALAQVLKPAILPPQPREAPSKGRYTIMVRPLPHTNLRIPSWITYVSHADRVEHLYE